MIQGSYYFKGTSGQAENIDLGGKRRVNVSRYDSVYERSALNEGTVRVWVPLTSSNWMINCSIIVTLYDKDGNTASTEQILTFSRNPTVHMFTVPVPLEEGFDIYNIKYFEIEDAVPYRKIVFLTNKECNIEALYVVPTQVGEPTEVYCDPDSVADGNSMLRWSGHTDGDFNPITGFDIYRSTTEIGSYTTKLTGDGPLPPTATSFEVESRSGRDKQYFYKVKVLGYRKGFDSEKSQATGVLTTQWTEPEPATNLTLSATLVSPYQKVTLSWDACTPGLNNPAVRYDVFRQIDVYDYELIDTVYGTSCIVDPPADNGAAYRFAVVGIGKVESFDSPMSEPSPDLRSTFTAPVAPQNVTVNGKSVIYLNPGERATVSWFASADGVNNPLQGYRVYSNDQQIGYTTDTTYSVAAAQNAGETLRIYVRAVGHWSMSQPSNTVEVITTLPPVPPRSNDAITQFMFFSAMDELQFVRDDAISMRVIEEQFRVTGSFPYVPDKAITVGMRIGWLQGDELRIYDIRQPETNLVSMVQSFEGEHAAVAQLHDVIVQPISFADKTAVQIVGTLLQDTAWSIGHVNITQSIETMDIDSYPTVWDAIMSVSEAYVIQIVPRMAYTYSGIERYIDLLYRRGENRGVRLTLDMNVQQAGVIYDDRDLYTALYGVGKQLSVTDEETGLPVKRRLTFEGVQWSTQDGRPVNKPLGQRFVADDTAAALWHRKANARRYGTVVFDQISNPHALLQATWESLQATNRPRVTIKMTAIDLSTIGYAAQGIALGDDVVVILDDVGIELMARVNQLDRDVLHPEQSKPTIGDYREDVIAKIAYSKKQQIAVDSSYTIDVDKTLTIEGLPADAKAVGDRLQQVLPRNVGPQNYLKILRADNNGVMQLVNMPDIPEPVESVVFVSSGEQTGVFSGIKLLTEITLPAGNWLVTGHVFNNSKTTTNTFYARLWIIPQVLQVIPSEDESTPDQVVDVTAVDETDPDDLVNGFANGNAVNAVKLIRLEEETTIRMYYHKHGTSTTLSKYRMEAIKV